MTKKRQVFMSIEDAPRDFMIESLTGRLNQILNDLDYYNNIHPNQKPITIFNILNSARIKKLIINKKG